MEKNPIEEEEESKQPTSLFPLLPISNITPKPTTSTTTTSSASTSQSLWLYNSSFTADVTAINDTVSNLYHPQAQEDYDEEDQDEDHVVHRRSDEEPRRVYEPLESSDSDKVDSGEKKRRRKDEKTKKRKKKRKRQRSSDDRLGPVGDLGSRKSNVRAWVDSDSKPSKDYFFDSHGDRDNLAFGCLYRMDVARYKPHSYVELCGANFQGLSRRNWTNLMLGNDGDIDALDSKLKFGGRYWSAKYMAFEGHKDLKRIRNVAPHKFQETFSDDFISLANVQDSVIEESWEDEVLCKTRDFNKLTQERPHDDKVWLEFAEFQDRLADKQPQKGARLQILEKKISILEKAVELNPDNEEILLCLLMAYQSRDNSDVLIGRWEKILMQHPSSYRLWKEFLHVVQGEFSRFKVSEIRKMYAAAIQALSAACSKHSRQVHHEAKSPTLDSTVVELELGLVDVFLNLCRLEWQAGYQELATGLFQAEIEYSLFSPSLLLTDQSKQRLFEHFWKSETARVGEEDALGWCTWLTKEEESRQSSHDVDEGGWTGWLEPFSKSKGGAGNPDNEANSDIAVDESQLVLNGEDVKEEDDTEALLKKLGIDVDAEISGEVKDTSTWRRWSEEELSRDCDQWMPVHTKSGGSDGTPDADEHLLRVIMYEDVNEYLFSLNTSEARFSLVSQFIDFYGGKISQGICTNSSTWIEKTLSLVDLPDSLAEALARVHNVLHNSQSASSGSSLESLLGSTNDFSKRADMMKFLRNATLLCLTAFPRNHILEEAALVAEELSATKMNSSSCSVTPCRALAKSLLKSDRQDLLLCGVYARREAFYGNMDYARKVFDMALLSIEGLPREQQSNAPLLYLWYAELERVNTPGDDNESSFRAVHILSCFGGNVRYVPFKRQPSNLQLLQARQGFKERMKIVQSAWVRGVIDELSIAVVCASALFEELTSGWAAAIEVLDRVLMMVLPERRSSSYEMELLFKFYVRMLERHHHQLSLSKCWKSIFCGLQIFPFSPELYSALVEIGNLHTTPNRLRWMLDDYCHRKQSVVVWLFALTFEISRGGSKHRIHGMFERALAVDSLHKSVLLWRCYIGYELTVACNPSAAKRVFFRAIHACPWSKKLWLDGFLKLNTILSAKEMSDLQEVMRDKELNLRTDIYEILLQDDIL